MELIDPRELGLVVVRTSGVEAQCLCPFHHDHTPSSSFNMETGLFHCFACGEDANLSKLISYLGGRAVLVDSTVLGKIAPHADGDEDEWMWVLASPYAIGNEYLRSRRVTDEEVMTYKIRQTRDGVAFVSTDLRGQPVGAQIRLYHGDRRYLTMGEKPALWPLGFLPQSKQGAIVFVEGVFGALNARRHGVNAYAVMGVSSATNAVQYANGFRRKVLVFDNDEAGKISAMKMLALEEGFEAYCPGAEADEVGPDFWANLLKTRHITNHTEFWQASGASRGSLAAAQKFIRRRRIGSKRT